MNRDLKVISSASLSFFHAVLFGVLCGNISRSGSQLNEVDELLEHAAREADVHGEHVCRKLKLRGDEFGLTE